MCGMDVFQPEISKNYGKIEWRDDLKKLLKQTGGLRKKVSFLITDSQIKEEVFLEDIDALLNSGEVPNLFAADEKAELMEVRNRSPLNCFTIIFFCFIGLFVLI